MLYIFTLISILIVLFTIISFLIAVAFVTIAERKTMGSMQRRLGPNIVGIYGFMQPFADALKLLLKEYILPALSNKILFSAAAYITLMFSLLALAMMPFGPGLSLSDFSLGILYVLSTFSLSTYGILLAGWSANSKYAFLGSLRSTAQLISYELILTSAILLVALLWGSFNLSSIVESQKSVWSAWPLCPVFYIFFQTCIAETNRAPFDLAEAESELVSGYMTEHGASVFVSFFLAEYSSIVLICIFTSILFLGGYLIFFKPMLYITEFITKFVFGIEFVLYQKMYKFFSYKNILSYNIIDGLLSSITLGLKAIILIFSFIWIRASFPRIRFDQLIIYCWTILLAIIVSFIIIIPCILYSLEMVPSNDILFSSFTYITCKYRLISSCPSLTISKCKENSVGQNEHLPKTSNILIILFINIFLHLNNIPKPSKYINNPYQANIFLLYEVFMTIYKSSVFKNCWSNSTSLFSRLFNIIYIYGVNKIWNFLYNIMLSPFKRILFVLNCYIHNIIRTIILNIVSYLAVSTVRVIYYYPYYLVVFVVLFCSNILFISDCILDKPESFSLPIYVVIVFSYICIALFNIFFLFCSIIFINNFSVYFKNHPELKIILTVILCFLILVIFYFLCQTVLTPLSYFKLLYDIYMNPNPNPINDGNNYGGSGYGGSNNGGPSNGGPSNGGPSNGGPSSSNNTSKGKAKSESEEDDAAQSQIRFQRLVIDPQSMYYLPSKPSDFKIEAQSRYDSYKQRSPHATPFVKDLFNPSVSLYERACFAHIESHILNNKNTAAYILYRRTGILSINQDVIDSL